MSSGSRSAIIIPIVVLLLSSMLSGPAYAQSDSIFVHCRVFHDLDEDGVRQGGEPGLADVRITNGVDVLATDGAGELDLWVDREQYRFATMTIPAGFWPTTDWYHWVPVGTAGPDTVDFGLRTNSATATDPVHWVHITDTQIKTWGHGKLDVDLLEINELALAPSFLINTGDIVEVGSDSTHWNNYLSQLAISDFPVLHVVGNHDTLGTSTPMAYYELYVGPPYYSVEVGSWHLMIYNNENPAVGTPAQDVWWDNDIAATPAGRRLVMYQHNLLKQSPVAVREDWAADGILASFSGHWHSLQLTDRPEGILEFNLGRTPIGPLDRTPRAFGFVTFRADGTIGYELRRFSVDHRSEITHPQSGQTLGGSSLEVMVQAYDTSSLVSSLSASVSGPGGAAGPVSLVQHGISLWREALDVSLLPDGTYDVTVSGAFADGSPISIMSSFERGAVVPIVRDPSQDWPMFRNGPAGSSFVAEELVPPLELVWSTPSAGLVALNSPVVRDGTVYLGSRPERDMSEAGITAYDAETGAVDWFTHLPGGTALAPAAASGVVVATAMTDSVYGLDATTGQPLWSTASPISRYHMTAPVFSGNLAWVGGEPRPLQIQWASGTVDWETDRLGGDWFPYIYSGPAVGANYVYFGFYGVSPLNSGGLAIVDRATGGRVWVDEGAFRSPIWTGTTLYAVGDADKNNQRLTARDELGAISWTSPVNFGNGTGSPALGHDVIVVAGRDGTIEGVSASDGASLWSHPVGSQLFGMVSGVREASGTMGTPAITGRVAYVGSLDGYLYALDLDAGTELWKWYFGTPVASSPAVSGNMLFVGASDGHLYAFQSTTPPVGASVEAPRGASVFTFYPPRPNPSAAATQFSWVMPERAHVRLAIHDVAGRRVRTLVDEERDPGEDFAVWDGKDRHGRPVASGIYFARLAAGPERVVKKLVRLRR